MNGKALLYEGGPNKPMPPSVFDQPLRLFRPIPLQCHSICSYHKLELSSLQSGEVRRLSAGFVNLLDRPVLLI